MTMSVIENIFLSGDIQHNELQKNRIKMGEVYKLPNERYALVCIHCTEEFQYFSEFTLHVQEYFQQLLPPKVESIPVSLDAFIKLEDDLNLNSPQIEEITFNSGENLEKQAIETTSTKNIDSEKTIGLNQQQQHLNDIEHSDNSMNDFMDDFTHNDSDIEPNSRNVEQKMEIHPKLETKEIVLKSSEEKKHKKQIKKSPKKKAGTKNPSRISAIEKRAIMESKKACNNYEKLLGEFVNGTENPMDPLKFEIFKAEKMDGLFPCTIKDTAEVRFLATLSVHTFKYEKIGREFLCPICSITFPNPAAVRRHIFSHVKEPVFLCGFCSEKFRAIRYLRGHLNAKHNDESRSFECFLCHKQFQHNQFRALKDHIQTHLIDSMNCVLCNKKFKEYRFYQLHMMNIHPQGFGLKQDTPMLMQPVSYREKPFITTFECYLCKKDFRERRLLRSHLKLHTQQPRLCLVCGIFCSSATSLSRHMKLHQTNDQTSHICTICGKGFKIRQYLLRHRRKEHQLWADNTPPVCQICGAFFNKKSLLHQHMKTHPFEETRNFICTICNHAARNAYNLKRHLLTHSSDRSFECPICQKTFHPRYAKDHMKSHTGPRNHKCPDCGKKFKRKYALKQHSYQHGGAPEHKCDICGRAFARTDKLLRHRRRHGIPLNYHCKICLKGFISQKSYLLHESSHIKSELPDVGDEVESNQTTAEFGDDN